MRTLCIFHGNCADGFAAAWVVKQAWDAEELPIEFHAGHYGAPVPDLVGVDRLFLVDFSYKQDVMRGIAAQVKHVVVLDHHKTAQADLAPLLADGTIDGVFAMGRSGATITWDWFFPYKPCPQLLLHVEDRDLWRFALPGTREIQSTVFSHPYDFDVWSKLISSDMADLRKEGEALERKHMKDVRELLTVCQRTMVIGGYTVPVANLPYVFTSDAGHLMAEGQPFAACYWDTPDGRTFSLRSTDAGVDVSAIAASFGGGGHRNAAGFKKSIGWEGEGSPE